MTRSRIRHSRPSIGGREIAAATRVLRSRHLAQGREVERLEAELAEYLGIRHAVAVSSGSAALHLALLALQPRGAAVLAPSYVCAAVLNAIRLSGATEVLVDCEPGGFQMDAAAAARAALAGVAAAVVPHLFGHEARLEPLLAAGVPLIEDCAMALGARSTDGAPLGRRGRAAVFSFYATKTVAGGEGGLVATADRALADEVRDRRAYDKKDDWRPRFNYKLTDLQAAVIRAQLARLETMVARRREVAQRYRERLQGSGLTLPPMAPGACHSRYVVRARSGAAAAIRHLAAHGVESARPVYRPLHRYLGLEPARYPGAEAWFLTAFSLPIYPDLTRSEIARVAAIASAFGRRKR